MRKNTTILSIFSLVVLGLGIVCWEKIAFGSVGFAPSENRPLAWLRVAEIGDISKNERKFVFSDISGNQWKVRTTHSSHKPEIVSVSQFPHHVLRFDGIDDFMVLDSLAARLKTRDSLTIIYVARVYDKAGDVIALQAADRATDILRGGFDTQNRARLKANPKPNSNISSRQFSTNEFAIFSIDVRPGDTSLFVNGKRIVTDNYFRADDLKTAKYFSIGHEWHGQSSHQLFQGELAEMIVFEKSISAPERAQWEESLQERYLIDLGNIPNGDPISNVSNPGSLEARNNFHIVDSDPYGFALFRSARPDAEAIATWCDLGISEVLVMSGDIEHAELAHKSNCPGLEIVYNKGQSEHEPLDTRFLEFFDSWITQAKKEHKKVLFRCFAGAHRTGRVAAYYAMKHQGLSYEAAVELMFKNGVDMGNHRQLNFQVEALQDHILGRPCRYLENPELAEKYCVKNS